MEYESNEQFIVFVDFLGFQEISTRCGAAFDQKVLALLQKIASLRGEYRAERVDDEYVDVQPTISTFSDHIVMSYPMQSVMALPDDSPKLSRLLPRSLWPGRLVAQAASDIAYLAEEALHLGMLIRGGATIGPLFHANGVVFGEAMVDAFLLESNVAVYPRVVLSKKISESKEWLFGGGSFMRRSEDGFRDICYIKLLWENVWPDDKETRTAWVIRTLSFMESQIVELINKNKPRQAAKWLWLSQRVYDETIGSFTANEYPFSPTHFEIYDTRWRKEK
ncbi:MAG: hypothetical protein F8N39_00965 [Clostridiaceae bacterium]|nr:hypothetical protein [Clostridiaceae bacterium]